MYVWCVCHVHPAWGVVTPRLAATWYTKISQISYVRLACHVLFHLWTCGKYLYLYTINSTDFTEYLLIPRILRTSSWWHTASPSELRQDLAAISATSAASFIFPQRMHRKTWGHTGSPATAASSGLADFWEKKKKKNRCQARGGRRREADHEKLLQIT